MKSTVPVFKPLIEEEELAACREALEMGWLGVGSYVGNFEKAISEFVGGGRQAVTLSTGHAAAHLALLLMGVGPGDEVITPSFNNIADFQAIRATGAEPVFCDIDDSTLCIDPDSAEQLISPRTRAVIAMDYAAQICDHNRISDLAQRHGLRVLHDAAHSFGSLYEGNRVGSFSDITMFSFDPIKNITTIDGGALMVKDERDVAWLREARLIGMGQPAHVMYENRRAWTYDVSHIGFRYHLANLHAAIGIAQLAKIERIAETRRVTARKYSTALAGLDGLDLPPGEFSGVVPFIYYVRVKYGRREAFCEHLKTHGVETGLHWQAGHRFSYFKDCRRGGLATTENLVSELVTLPLHSAMPDHTSDRVIDATLSFFK